MPNSSRMLFFQLLVCFITVAIVFVNGCSNIVVSPEASTDNSAIVAYNADSGSLYGSLYHYPASKYAPNTMRKVYDWDSGVYLGEIPEVAETYNVVGNINEHGVVIGETTFGGVGALQQQPGALVDYGSLIWITLQRAKTAREAIKVMNELVNTYGYYSEGESFSIADNNEAWILEMIGKGAYEKGAVWVAMKVPAGYVTAHANQARIRQFYQKDNKNDYTTSDILYSNDVISFARKIGLYSADASDEEFSFSDIYDPVTFSGARFCDARVWSFFSSIMGEDFSNQYVDYAMGRNLTNRMPLFVKPIITTTNNNKLSVQEVMEYMRSHYENSALDMQGVMFNDVGAMLNSIYRAHPLTWTSTVPPTGIPDSKSVTYNYVNERPIATPQTGWNFVAQARKNVPDALRGLLWFGVDDSGTTVRFPIYGSATRIPASFAGAGAQDGVVSPMMKFDLQSAFYVFNMLANFAYNRWDLMFPEIHDRIVAIETDYQQQINALEKELTNDAHASIVEKVTNFSEQLGNQLVKDWFTFFGELFVKYRDGYIVTKDDNNKACGCNPVSANYPQQWRDRIVKDTKDHYYELDQDQSKKFKDNKFQPVSKTSLKALK